MNAGAFYAVAGGFTGGIVIRSFIDLGVAFGICSVGIGLLLALLMSRQKPTLLIALVIIGGGLGSLRFDLADERAKQPLSLLVGSRVALAGVVVDEPDERAGHTNLSVELRGEHGEWLGRALVTTDIYPRRTYGDQVRVAGELERPDVFEDEGGRTFDYEAYLRKEGICCVMYYPSLEYISGGSGNVIVAALFQLKDAFLERVARVIPEPQSALLGGLLLGAKQSLGEEELEVFRRVGIIHIVVLSGYNLLIVARFLMRMLNFKFLSVWTRTGIGMAGIVLFALMTGASATTVRATGMALLSLAAKATSRLYLVTRALVVAGLLMLIVNPYLLVFDASFQLSFLATVGLIFFSPWFEARFSFLPERFGLREIAAATVATQLAVLPLLLYQTGLFSLVSLPVNLLVLPMISLTMLLGFLTGILGFVSSLLSLPLAYLTHLLLSYVFVISDWFNALPFAAYDLGLFPAWGMVGLYVLLVALIVYLRKSERRVAVSLG